MIRNHKKWARAFFTPHSESESIDNNMNEVFNAHILSSRHKPIITILEDIKEGLMEKLHKKKGFYYQKKNYDMRKDSKKIREIQT